MKRITLTLIALTFFAVPLSADSYYPIRPEDPRAVYFTKDQFENMIDDMNQLAWDAVNDGLILYGRTDFTTRVIERKNEITEKYKVACTSNGYAMNGLDQWTADFS